MQATFRPEPSQKEHATEVGDGIRCGGEDRAASASLSRVTVVIVLFRPKPDDVDNIERMTQWGTRVVVVANASTPQLERQLAEIEAAEVIANPTNVGLARALNQGLSTAMRQDETDYALLLDQDSRATRTMVLALLRHAVALHNQGVRLACVAPVLRDRKAGEVLDGAADLAGTRTFATSGTLITRTGWTEVGAMFEELFIDGIDHEWCFRATHKGAQAVLCPEAILEHDMGEDAVMILGRFRPIHHSPVRHYFIIRNTLWLSRMTHVPIGWWLKELAKLLYRIPVYIVVSNDRAATVRNILRALSDGASRTRKWQAAIVGGGVDA